MQVFVVVAALCVALGGCVTSNSQPAAAPVATKTKTLTPYTLSKDDIAAVQKGVRLALKDPDSAKFGRMVAGSEGSDVATVCLMVNAKNSYGGYTGEKPYMGVLLLDKKPRVFVAYTDTKPEHLQYRDQATLNVCSDFGLAL